MKQDKKKLVRLYSGFFPFYGVVTANYSNVPWMLLCNFALMILVPLAVFFFTKTPDLKGSMKKTVWRACVTSLLADALGLFIRFLPLLMERLLYLFGARGAADWLAKNVSDFTWYEIWANWNPIGLPWTVLSILAAGVFAFLLNYFVMMKKAVPEKKKRLVLSILLALVTAPYSWTNPAW